MNLSRRDLLKVGLFSSAALMLPAERIARTQLALTNRIPESQLPDPFSVPFVTPPVLKPEFQTPEWAYYQLEQRQVQAEILPGLRTTIWGYNGITPGPTIMNTQSQQAVVRQINNLPDVHPSLRYNVWTSTHLHGSRSLPQYDGYASDITLPGRVQGLPVPRTSRTPGRSGTTTTASTITAENAYMGLAAQYILHDALELALPIPHGKYDVPLILKDAMFAAERRPGLRRQQRVGDLRRRHPGQRQAVADDGGRAAQVPLPHPQRVGVALVRPLAATPASR